MSGTVASDAGVVTRGHGWRPLRPEIARDLVDARLQLHHAAQLVAAMGISYLDAQPDDSHTNFECIESLSALASNEVHGGTTPVRLAVSASPLALILVAAGQLRATLRLHARTIRETVDWIRAQLAECGLRAETY